MRNDECRHFCPNNSPLISRQGLDRQGEERLFFLDPPAVQQMFDMAQLKLWGLLSTALFGACLSLRSILISVQTGMSLQLTGSVWLHPHKPGVEHWC